MSARSFLAADKSLRICLTSTLPPACASASMELMRACRSRARTYTRVAIAARLRKMITSPSAIRVRGLLRRALIRCIDGLAVQFTQVQLRVELEDSIRAIIGADESIH